MERDFDREELDPTQCVFATRVLRWADDVVARVLRWPVKLDYFKRPMTYSTPISAAYFQQRCRDILGPTLTTHLQFRRNEFGPILPELCSPADGT